MFSLAFESAIRSIIKTPGVSLLVVIAIALGIGVTMPMVTLYHNINGDPLPQNGGKVYRVLIDNWIADQPFRFNSPDMPADFLAARDARSLMNSNIPSRVSASYGSQQYIRSAADEAAIKPFFAAVRITNRDFFEMFEAPFSYGGPWDTTADDESTNVTVINNFVNQVLFGGGNNVGRELKIGDQIYTVVGILDSWSLVPRVYDMGQSSARTEGLFVPLSNFKRGHLKPSAFASPDQATIDKFDQAFLSGETLFTILWVQLDTDEQVLAYQDFIDGYVLEQKSLGRMQKPVDNRLYSATQWIDVAPSNLGSKNIYTAFIVIGVFFLLVCLLNLLSLLLSKFLSVASEACVTRALGATRAHIFQRYVIEVVLLGFIGGLFSIYITKVVLAGIQWVYLENLPPEYKQIQNIGASGNGYIEVDTTLLLVTMGLTFGASLLSALYPAWRACRVPPAEHLKMN